MDVTVYTTPGCQACRATKRHLTLHAIGHTERDLTGDAEALAYVKDRLGHHSAPVIVVRRDDGDIEHWSGYRPDRLNQLAVAPNAEQASPAPRPATPERT